MLLVLDVGNTNTVLGVYEMGVPGFAGKAGDPARLAASWRVATSDACSSLTAGPARRTS